jgi:hypothetical protein
VLKIVSSIFYISVEIFAERIDTGDEVFGGVFCGDEFFSGVLDTDQGIFIASSI